MKNMEHTDRSPYSVACRLVTEIKNYYAHVRDRGGDELSTLDLDMAFHHARVITNLLNTFYGYGSADAAMEVSMVLGEGPEVRHKKQLFRVYKTLEEMRNALSNSMRNETYPKHAENDETYPKVETSEDE